jgi:Ferritin-like domain
LALSSQPALAASGLTDVQILNFALNLEYLEAEYYLRAVSGQGLNPSLTTGVGTKGAVTGGSLVPFSSTQGAFTAVRIAIDELSHVEFLRSALGAAAVAEPSIALQTSFTTLAIAAGLIQSGQTFNPFASELDFLIGAYIFEDVGVTAYAGAAAAISSPANLFYAASILAIEAYHAGAIRLALAQQGQGNTTDAISAMRAKLSGVGDTGTNAYGNPFNISNVDQSGLAFRRTPAQVLSIVCRCSPSFMDAARRTACSSRTGSTREPDDLGPGQGAVSQVMTWYSLPPSAGPRRMIASRPARASP